jgi:hypothetical protein
MFVFSKTISSLIDLAYNNELLLIDGFKVLQNLPHKKISSSRLENF